MLVIAIAGFVAFMAYNRGEPVTERDMAQPGPGDRRNSEVSETPLEIEPSGDESETDLAPVAIPLDAVQLEVLDLISQGRFIEARAAIALYQKERRFCPTCEFLHGLSFHKEKRYELARPFFEKAIELEGRYAPTWYFYGWCLYYLGELDESRAAFEHHLALNPLGGDSHFGLGLIAMDDGDLEEAETRFREAIELQEHNPRRVREVAKAHARLGDVFTLQDKLDEAKTQLFLATELWPGHYEAQFKLARVLYRLGEDEAAGAAMRKFEAAQQRRQGIVPAPEPGEEEPVEEERSEEDGSEGEATSEEHEVGP